MNPRRWSLLKAAALGAGVGVAVHLVHTLTGDAVPANPYEAAGQFTGSMIGGILLFTLAAWVRNRFVR